MKQVMSGLAFMNSKGFFHRDIKVRVNTSCRYILNVWIALLMCFSKTHLSSQPENLLVDLSNHNVMDGKGILIKIADLGLARTMTPPFTYYVSTRWYRAPEVILHAPHYGPAIDMFACGLIVWELYTLHPLFPGTSEIDQIHKMMKLLGSPERKWGEGMLLMNKLNVRFENVEHVENAVIEVRICRDVRGKIDAANLICKLIQWDPEERPNATEALMHEYFGDAAHTLGPDACARTDQKYTEFNRDSGTRFRLQNNDENRHKQWPRASIDEDSMRETTEKEDNATNRFWRNGSRMEQQPNEFCDYLNAVTSSEVGGSLLNHQTIPRSGPQQPALTSSVKFKPCALLSHATPYKSSMSNVAQTNVRSTKRHGRRSLNRPNRNRVSEKPSWLLANQSMGRRAVEVTIGHSCKAGAQQMNHRNEERDSVWNPF